MRWRGGRLSTNVEDQRGGGGRGLPIIGGGLGTLLLLLLIYLLGGDPSALLQTGNPPGSAPPSAQIGQPAGGQLTDEQSQFVAAVLADTEDVWGELFARSGSRYIQPKLVLFTGRVHSACGLASTAAGPFYCPSDQRLYIDLAFYDELRQRFGAPGDFAQAYVIAHEVGHHVQNLLGITDKVDAARNRLSEEEYNHLSVRLELQADFLAGVWAHHAQRMRGILEQGDLEEAIQAATAIGDDTLQKQSQGYVVPDSFTHGTSAQRVRWFRRGYETGDINQGNTFTLSDKDL